MAKEWYRNETWNETIATEFETKLKRARGDDSKAQYLELQGCTLLFVPDEKVHLIGINLLNRLFANYPSETLPVVGGYNALGVYYLKNKDWKQAEHYFRTVVSYLDIPFIQSPFRDAKLKLAETLLHSENKVALSEAYDLIRTFPVDELMLNSQLFYFYNLAALVCDALNKKTEAKEYAGSALELASITEPQFSRHKTVGLVQATEQQISMLQLIL